MEPITRKEVFLDALCDGEGCSLEPVTREEVMLKRLTESVGGSGGSGGGSLIVHAIENSDDTVSSDKTRSEICDAIDSGKVVFLDMYGGFYPLQVVAFADGVVDRDSLIRFGGMSRIVDALYLVEIAVHEERTLIYNECKIQDVDM